MTGDDIRRLRKRLDLTQEDLGRVIANALGRDKPYTTAAVRHWEAGTRNPTTEVAVLLAELSVANELPPEGERPPPLEDAPAGVQDSAPTGPDSPAPGSEVQPPLGSGGVLARACEELFELIATGVGMIGGAIGSEPLVADGMIIAADKEALGKAWGKLAETNETFRKMLMSMTEGGAWLTVAVVTGTTVSKCYQSHMAYAAHVAAQAGTNGQPDYAEPAEAAA